jgi:hypothetical protein
VNPSPGILNHAGDSPENPLVSGFRLKARLCLHHDGGKFRRCWVTTGGRAGPPFLDLTDRCVQVEEETYVVMVVGADLAAGDPPILNAIHFTTQDDVHSYVEVYAFAPPAGKITLDGYDGQDPNQPVIVPVYLP